MHQSTRRRFLQTTGIVAGGLAGCTGGGGGGSDVATVSGEEYPDIDEWLTETSVGAADENYDGTLLDWTGRDTVTVDVGADGNGGAFAFGPPAVVVSAGTTVEFSWTSEGGAHNVEALPDEQLGKSDYEFTSGEAENGTGVLYSHTMDEAGVALYHCEPHLSLGMKGGIAVE